VGARGVGARGTGGCRRRRRNAPAYALQRGEKLQKKTLVGAKEEWGKRSGK
jgi:hypothetical protein